MVLNLELILFPIFLATVINKGTDDKDDKNKSVYLVVLSIASISLLMLTRDLCMHRINFSKT